MKYYIINSDGKEVSFDVSSVTRTDNGSFGFTVDTESGQKNYFVKSLAGKNYISEDQVSWRKAPAISRSNNVVNVNESMNVYRGFKPSGLAQGGAGSLVTDMPGKVVKVLTAEGAMVNQGDTLLILEAMKMENEIKAGMDGTVKTVNVSEGQNLESGHLMIEIEE